MTERPEFIPAPPVTGEERVAHLLNAMMFGLLTLAFGGWAVLQGIDVVGQLSGIKRLADVTSDVVLGIAGLFGIIGGVTFGLRLAFRMIRQVLDAPNGKPPADCSAGGSQHIVD